jgi:hypothetical protein
MSASVETNVGLLETAEPDAHCALRAKIRKYRRLFANEADCEHLELVFDEIDDVYCKHCRKDFTG